jgi:tetratricopeptide (TPR) repeat protein
VAFPEALSCRFGSPHLIGEGGVGHVYQALERQTGEAVAIKLIASEHFQTAPQRRAFLQEARTCVRLQHPHIVRLFDFDAPAAHPPYLVMEYLSGGNLGQWRDRWPGWSALLVACADILLALAHAHGRGVIHCDLKPENILFSVPPGDVPQTKLTDFGVAHLSQLSARPQPSADGWHARGFAGTPTYMAPEQAKGYLGAYGPWTDLYAIGVILFEIISGAPPFGGHSDATVLMQHLQEPLPPLTFREGAQPLPEIEPLLRRMLDKNLWARPRFAAQARAQLLALLPSAQGEAAQGVAARAAGASPLPDLAPLEQPQTARVRALLLRDPPLLGRDGLLDRLCAYARAAVEQRSLHVILIEGPAGIGKSRLADALLQRLEEEGEMQALFGSCRRDSLNDTAPLGAVAALERYYLCAGLDRAQTEGALTHLLGQPGTLDPDALRGLLDLLRPTASQPPVDDPTWADLVAAAITRACDRAPVALCLDDLHHDLDGLSLSLLERLLAFNTAPFPCLVILTMRALDSDADPTGRLRHRLQTTLSPAHLADSAPPIFRVELPPLNDLALFSLLNGTLSLADTLSRHIVRKAQGNPFVALQHARAALELSGGAMPSARSADVASLADPDLQGQDAPPLLVSPLTSQRLLSDTLRRLLEPHPNPDGMIALGMLSLMAPRVLLEELVTALRIGWPDLPWDITLPPLLDAALHVGLLARPVDAVTPVEGGATPSVLLARYEPLNRLLSDHLARQGWTRRAHMAAAQALESLYGAQAALSILAARARHLARAHCHRDAWRLLKQLLRDQLVLGYFSQTTALALEARRWLDEWEDPPYSHRRARLSRSLAFCAISRGDLRDARRVLDDCPPPHSPTDDAHRRWLYGELALESGDFDAAEAALLSSLDAFHRLPAPHLTEGYTLTSLARLYRSLARFDDARAHAHSALDFFSSSCPLPLGQAAALHALGQIEAIAENLPAGLHFYQQALHIADPLLPSHTLANIHQSIAGILVEQRLYPEAEHHITLARQGFELCGDQRGLARILRTQARTSRDLGHTPQAIHHLERAILLFNQLHDFLSAADCHLDLAGILRKINKFDAAQQQIQVAMRHYATLHHDLGRANALIILGNLLLDMGNSQQAMSRLEAAQALARRLDDPSLLLLSTINLGRTLMNMGQSEPAHLHLLHAQTLALSLEDPTRLAVAIAYDLLAAPSSPADLIEALTQVQRCLPDGASPELGTALEQLADNLSPPPNAPPTPFTPAIRLALDLAGACFDSSLQPHITRRINQKRSALSRPAP